MQVAVQVPAYKEGRGMLETLTAIRDQPVPPEVDLSYEVWVTPDDSGETWAAAQEATGWAVHEAPRGKLTARNLAHERAVSRGTDVIVSWDADSPPMHAGVLRSLLGPYSDPRTVATNGWYEHTSRVRHIEDLARSVDFALFRPIYGRLSSLTADAWMAAGPFDDARDQTDMLEVRTEEEFAFRRRLEDVGRVVDVRDARVLGDSRRYECTVAKITPWGEPSEWCEERGGLTSFRPRRRWR